jgi:fluoride exporter
MPLSLELLLVAVGGALGGLARHGVAAAVDRRLGGTFPFGTLAVNASGAAAIGVLAGLLLADGRPGAPSLWMGLVVGVLGSYTTVSSFSLQTLALARTGRARRAALNVAGSVALCLGAAALGHAAVLALRP